MCHFFLSLRALLVSAIICHFIRHVRADGTITVTDGPAYSSLLPCAQKCIFSYNLRCPDVPDPIGNAIGCYDNTNAGCMRVSWAMDSCYCRTDLQAAAVKAISTCVKSQCTIGDIAGDISSVSAVYGGYCSAAGYIAAAPAATTAAATSNAATNAATDHSSPAISNSAASGPSSTSASGSTTSAPASSSSSSSLSTGALVGIIVPVCSGVLGLAAAVYKFRTARQKRKAQKESQTATDKS